MEHLKSPLKSGTKDYLMKQIVPTLIEGLTQLSITRPGDPHKFLASFLLKKSPKQQKYVIMSETEIEALRSSSEGTEAAVGSAVSAARLLSATSDEAKGEAELGDGAEAKTETKVELELDPAPQPEIEDELKAGVEPSPENEAEIETEAEPEIKSEAETEAKAEPKLKPEPEPEREAVRLILRLRG